LIETGGFAQAIIDYPLPKGPGVQLGQQFGGFTLGGFWASDGSAYSMTQFGFGARPQAQLLRLRSGRQPQPVGDQVRAYGFALAEHTAVAWSCSGRSGEVSALDPTARRPQWRSIATGCAASLSTDGTIVAYADGGSVWTVASSGGTPTRVFTPSEVPGLAGAGITRTSRPYATAISGGGVAALIGNPQEGFAILVSWHGSKARVIALGKNRPGELEWQPGGRLLAFTDYLEATQTAEARLFDPATGSITQVAATADYGVGRIVWAPDGAVLAVARSATQIAFVDRQGELVASASIGGFPDDWRA